MISVDFAEIEMLQHQNIRIVKKYVPSIRHCEELATKQSLRDCFASLAMTFLNSLRQSEHIYDNR
jgi:hypothetical protein